MYPVSVESRYDDVGPALVTFALCSLLVTVVWPWATPVVVVELISLGVVVQTLSTDAVTEFLGHALIAVGLGIGGIYAVFVLFRI